MLLLQRFVKQTPKPVSNGFWRGAVVLDFGKDLPKFCESLRTLPAREFVREQTEAFRGPLLEVGMVY